MSSSLRQRAVVVAGLVLVAGLTGCGGAEGGGASCAAVLEYDGHSYLGTGDLKRDPEVTGRSMPAVLPGCDDSGGQAEVEAEDIRVLELAEVPPGVAVLFQGSVYLREGRELPEGTQRWFRAVPCASPRTFRVAGDWRGVTSSRSPRFDGDLRVPYRLQVHVTSGPRRYVGSTITVRATGATDPALAPTDVEASLRHGGRVSAAIRCVERRFEALFLRAR